MVLACIPHEDAATTPDPAASGSDAVPVEPSTNAASPLAGTRWQLVEFQSMDDAQGVTRADDPSVYVMELNADGTVAMRLNCNRANGTWSARAAADGASGTFEYGPLAMTRALCPPPSLDEKIARDAQFVRGYLLRDGRLYLSLMADGGVYAWEPAAEEIAYETVPDPEIEDAIRTVSPDYTRGIVEAGSNDGRARYVYSRFDLDDDGAAEVLVYLLGPFFCGTGGCNLLIFTSSAEGYSLVSRFSVTRTPVIVTSRRSNGWRDLWRHRSGGGAPADYVADRFDGTRYVDGEAVPADHPPAGTRVLAGVLTFDRGIVLEPRD